MEMSIKRELSYGIVQLMPGGKNFSSSCILTRTALAVARALPLGDSCTPMPVEGLPLRRAEVA